ncbi:MAG: F0F1 ATP synthase subunit delta [Gammaproteobacteria bacterium]|jgi:F-type H+-transporting ATPase subunit delta|nr:F0F1 ATP synthase subunit delta [Gammaproteobacteria bacterium]
MLNRTTLARPYARAAFEAARDADALPRWSEALELASEIAATEELHYLSGDPRVGGDRLLELITDIGGDRFDESFTNFLKVVIINGRLALLPEIAAQYEQYRREAEERIRVEVYSARPMDDEESNKLAERLKARFGREVDMHVEVDESLIGGAVIRAGDKVIDGSVRGRLEQLGRRINA